MSFDPIAHTRATVSSGGAFINYKNIGEWCTIEVTNARPWSSPPDKRTGRVDEATALDGKYVEGNIPGRGAGDEVTVVLSGHKGTAFLEAVAEARLTHLVYPFRYTMGFVSERDTGEVQPMKLYQAKVEALQSTAVSSLPGLPPNPAPPPAPAPSSGPVSPFGAPAGQPGGEPAYAPQPPQANGGPPQGPPWAQVDGQWVAPGDPRYPQQPAAPAPPAAPPTAGQEPANPLGALFQ
jgi:hypothetical protein